LGAHAGRRFHAGNPFGEMPLKDAAGQGPSGGGGGRHGLNDFPDNVLVRVLRHLKAWEAVRTCLLSKRWCRLVDAAIATTTRLDIRQPCYCNQDRTEVFAAFVKNLLLRRRRSPHVELDALRLCWSHPAHDGDANIWIAHAVRHGAEEIEFSGAHHAGLPCPDYLSFVPGDKTKDMRLKVVRLIQVRLDGTTLRKLCSSLEELELKDCSVEGKEIHSDKLKRLNMIGCRFVDGFSVNSPKLVSLRCIRPFGYVPRFKNMAALVTVAIMLDDPCLRNDRQWPHKEDQQDESGDEVDFFGHAGSADSGGNSFAHSTAEESGDNNHNDSDDNSDYYHSDQSEPSDDKGGDRIICYSEIPIEHRKQTEYFINGKNSDFGGNDILCSLSNVETMDLLAHAEEVRFSHLADTTAFSFLLPFLADISHFYCLSLLIP
jgi:hypothetical protein